MVSALPLALTMGDPSGIGPEVGLKAWQQRTAQTPAFYVLGDPGFLRQTAHHLALDVPIEITTPQTASVCFARALPVVPLMETVTGVPGQPTVADAPATITAIARAVADVRSGLASAVVTNPISKDILYQAGFAHPGHTEFLGALAQTHYGITARPVMMIWSPDLAVVPVTIHIALADVPQHLTPALLEDTCHIVARDLRTRFGLARPRLALAGLNPHAGENGSMGREEIEIMAPVIARLRAQGLDLTGPLPADTMFTPAARARYDAAICMYHDQALIPAKTLAFDTAVNVTLGLPFVRTSPDHGTAYDIAGRGVANPASLVSALHLAARLAAPQTP